MSFLSVDELVELRKNNPQSHILTYAQYDPRRRDYLEYGPITPERAQEVLDGVKQATLAGTMRKINRPWELINLTEKLDTSQPWLGFEVETGWPDRDTYDRVVIQVLDNHNHVVIDREGFGPYPTEITFSPENYDTFVDGKSQVQQFYAWLKRNNLHMSEVPGAYVGTHLNVSTPAFRAASYEVADAVVYHINNAIRMMGVDGCAKVFGRMPYGLGHRRGPGTAYSWIEFKVFRSAETVEGFQRICDASKRLASVVEQVSLDKEITNVPTILMADGYTRRYCKVISNLAEILTGKEETVQWIDITAALRTGHVISFDLPRYLPSLINRDAA